MIERGQIDHDGAVLGGTSSVEVIGDASETLMDVAVDVREHGAASPLATFVKADVRGYL